MPLPLVARVALLLAILFLPAGAAHSQGTCPSRCGITGDGWVSFGQHVTLSSSWRKATRASPRA